jgi:molybdate transport system ATP-binding protein
VGALASPEEAAGAGLHLAVRVAYRAFRVELALALPGAGVTVLFGPSGAGKTTVLRLLAGLERGEGSVWVLGECWDDSARGIHVPTHARGVGTVFQEPALFPHLTVEGNLAYAERRRGRRAGGAAAVPSRDAIAAMLGIATLLERGVDRLSGGERQRVAIARALLSAPRLLLLDEPLAALDAARKAEIFPYLARLRDELAIPIIYVTHAVDELARLADHVVMLDAGRVVASGPAAEMLARADLAAGFGDDAGVAIDATIAEHDDNDHLTRVECAGGALWVRRVAQAPRAAVRVRVLARDVSLALEQPAETSILNVLPARVVEVRDDGPDRVIVRLALARGEGAPLLARVTRRSRAALRLCPGLDLYAQVKTVAVVTAAPG